MIHDAHNHLQDERFNLSRSAILEDWKSRNCGYMVVNGTTEKDWELVASLARSYPFIIPSFGLHPWFLKERTSAWQQKLMDCLDEFPKAAIGEIGLDGWIKNADIQDQLEVFHWQMACAAERNLPTTIHCLAAWGPLIEAFQNTPIPARGFLMHSYGGSMETARVLESKGAYFSISGYFAWDRKKRQQEVFSKVSLDRLLIETDAPDMLPPEEGRVFPGQDDKNQSINMPGNIEWIYDFAARVRGVSRESLEQSVEKNFKTFFGMP